MGIEGNIIPGLFIAKYGAFLECPHGLFNGCFMVLVGIRSGGSEYDIRLDLVFKADEGIEDLLPEFRELTYVKTKQYRV